MAAWNIVENDTIVKSQSIYMGEGYTQLIAEYVALLDSLIFVWENWNNSINDFKFIFKTQNKALINQIEGVETIHKM